MCSSRTRIFRAPRCCLDHAMADAADAPPTAEPAHVEGEEASPAPEEEPPAKAKQPANEEEHEEEEQQRQDDAAVQELTGDSWGPLAPLTPPPSGCVPVTEDGGVLKLVLQPGEGPKPKLYARCLGAEEAPACAAGHALADAAC